MASGYKTNEKYFPGKKYPADGEVSAEVAPGDELTIEKYLRGEFSRFGEYRVVQYLGRCLPRQNKGPQIKWKVQCSCGWEREISHDNLSCLRFNALNRDTVNCKSPQHNPLLTIGKAYDRLTIIGHTKGSWIGRTPKGNTANAWLLVMSCSCGKHNKENPYIAPPSYVLGPLNKGAELFGCGCRNASQDGRSKSPEHQRWENAKRRAKKFGLAFDIDINDCIAPKLCPVLGIPLSAKATGGPTDNSPTLDRIDPAKGYVKGNVAVISNRANRIKNDGTVDEIRKIADWLEQKLST